MSVSMDSSSTTLGQDDSPVPQTVGQTKNNRRYTGQEEMTPSVTPAQERQTSNDNQDEGQSRQPGTPPEEEEWLVQCRCENGKTLVTLLSCLQHVAVSPSDSHPAASATQASSWRSSQKKKTVQPVSVYCSPSGFTVHVFGPAKQSEASCELQKTMFSDYRVTQDEENQEDWQAGGEFCVNLTSVLDALLLLGPLDNRTSVALSFNMSLEIFKIELLQDGEQGVLCSSAIQSIMAPADDPEGDSLSNAFRSSPIAARMMFRSGILRELLPEWSSLAGASCASVAVSAKRGLELAVLGHYGECWVQIPPTGDHLVAPLECEKTVTRTYPLHSVLSSMKGLEIAEETCININTEGIMAIQHKTLDPTGQGASNFVDFIMTCLEDDDEDDDDGDETTAAGEDASTMASATQPSFRNRNSHPSQTQSPDTTTTGKHRRRRRRQRGSPSQDSRGLSSNMTGEDVEQGSSDTEGDGDTPSERQKRQANQKRKQEESDSSSSDEETQPMISAAPLFESVVREQKKPSSPDSDSDTPPRRRQRRSASRPPRQPQRGDGGAIDASANLRSSSEGEKDDSEEEEMRSTARTPARHHNRNNECSSPEIVYGKPKK